jgi:hypothetical protein
MNTELKYLLPLFLRSKDSLSEKEIIQIKECYKNYGREKVELFIKQEKSNRPFASLLLQQIDCDSQYWEQVHQSYIDSNTKILAFLDKLFSDYYQIGGKTLCVIENFGSMLSSGISLGCFASNDVDITADTSERELLIKVMSDNGFYINKRNNHVSDSKQISTFFNQDVLNNGYWINIMWKPISRAYLLVQGNYDKRLRFERLNNTECYTNTAIRILKPTAMVYFCALHIACGHYYSASPGMNLFCDVDRVVLYRSVEWEQIIDWSIADKAGIRVKMVLYLCNYYLGTPIPLNILNDVNNKNHIRLRNRLIDTKSGQLVAQDGKLNRLYTELKSDNIPLLWSLISRTWKR